jgi:phosphopantothenoylcysteine decarboxylase / phosphopantothenate---cysteine ligase
MAQQSITLLKDKHIVVGVTGSIAAYKSVDLASKLTQAGAKVDVVMTEAAQQFVTPLTFQAVTGRPVYTDLWKTESSGGLPTHIAHVGLAEGADLLIVAPTTANTLAKLAHGLADDLLTVTALAARCPLILSPAMDGSMYEHPATQQNVQRLTERDVVILTPEVGRFASGLTGRGRLPEIATLMGAVRHTLGLGGRLKGRKVVVSAGGTREAIDPVRYITNHSSGKQGYTLAQAALDEGAEVILVSTATERLEAPFGVRLVPVVSAEDMLAAVEHHAAKADVVIMAAAVADFRPKSAANQKIKKSDEHPDQGLTIELTRNPDILLAVKEIRGRSDYPKVVVGFAAESENLLQNAQKKLKTKGLDLLVANDISAADAGFNVDDNRVTILSSSGGAEEVSLRSKSLIAERVIERVINQLEGNDNRLKRDASADIV